MTRNSLRKLPAFAFGAAATISALTGAMGQAHAFEIKTGNPDVQMTWGNTIRYNAGWRMEKRNSVIANSSGGDEGDYSYDRGDMVTNRLDLLSELDFNYKQQFGFRVSGAAWYDEAFNDQVRNNPALPGCGVAGGCGSYLGNQFTNYTKRYAKGLSGEILDAFVFGNFALGEMPLSLKAGRHTVLWGEALALSSHSVSYAQAPTDGYKALANPGVDAKETALPIGQISGTLQVTPTLALSGQYYYEWQPTRLPQGGTYLASTDFILQGPDRRWAGGATFIPNEGIVKPKERGDWGVSARWRPEWLGGTVGAYYREFTEKSPTLSFNGASSYRTIYIEDAKLYGLSLAKSIAGLSVDAELVRREKTALAGTITNGTSDGPRGNTSHVLVNAVALLGPSKLWDLASITGEFAYSRWDKVTSGRAFFNQCDKPAGTAPANTGCVTKDAAQVFLRFGPQWVGVWPGWDIAASASYLVGVWGNGAVQGGGNYRAGSYGLGLTFTYNQAHDFSIAYNDYLATNEQNPATGAIRISNGSQLQDRGWLVFSYKGSF